MLSWIKRFISCVLVLALNNGFAAVEQNWSSPPSDLYTMPTFGTLNRVALSGDKGVAVWKDTDSNLILGSVLDYSTNTWTLTTTVSDPAESADAHLQLAMASNGNAVAIWTSTDGSDFFLQAATLPANSTTWIPTDTITLGVVTLPHVAVDAIGNAVVTWLAVNGPNKDALSARMVFGSGTWVNATAPLSTGDYNFNNVAVDPSGNAVAIFGGSVVSLGATVAAGSDTWTATNDFSNLTAFEGQVAVDTAGNAVAIISAFDGLNTFLEGASMTFGSNTWVSTNSIPQGPGDIEALGKLQIAPDGTAVAIWKSAAGIQSASLPSASSDWIAPTSGDLAPFVSLAGGNADLAIDAAGNIFATWPSLDDESQNVIQAALMAAGTNEWVVYSSFLNDTLPAVFPSIGASDEGKAVISWAGTTLSNETTFQAVINLLPSPPLPPSNFQGEVEKNIFLTRTEIYNVLTWRPSPDPSVVEYIIYSNGKVIATVPASGPFEVNVYNRRSKAIYIYTIVAVSENGLTSSPVTIAVP